MLARLRAALSGSGGSSRSRSSSGVALATRASTTTMTTTTTTAATAAERGCVAARASSARSLNVAVVGGGAGGLAAARELLKEGHRPVVFEQADSIGGVWIYDERAVDARPLGVGEGEEEPAGGGAPAPPSANATERQAPPLPWTETAHGSMYRDLRTNLPREVMGYLDYPFTGETTTGAAAQGGRSERDSARGACSSFYRAADARRYPGHAEVLRYLEAYADAFGLRRCFRLGTRVVRATPVRTATAERAVSGWRVASVPVERDASTGRLRPRRRRAPAGSSSGGRDQQTAKNEKENEEEEAATESEEELFDALVVANGHYALPNLPAVAVSAAARRFPGQQLHSHNYRAPDAFRGKRVVVVGASNSGADVADEIAAAGAELVLLSSRGGGGGGARAGRAADDAAAAAAAAPAPAPAAAPAARPNLRRRGMLCALGADGACAFDDGEAPAERVDAVIYATGYRYSFDFLDAAFGSGHGNEDESEGGASSPPPPPPPPPPPLRWRDQPGRVGPLFLHLFPAQGGLAPRLSFLGLPWKVVPFPLMQAQARLVARLLSGRAAEPLPAEREMLAAAAAEDAAREARGVPPRHAHVLDGEQWAYNAELLRRCGGGAERADDGGALPAAAAAAAVAAGRGEREGEPPVPGSWRARLYDAARENKRANPGGLYRDRWIDDDGGAAAEAAAEFAALRRAWEEGQVEQQQAEGERALAARSERAPAQASRL